ncbi:glyoxalase [Pseudoalteromonas porphyrae]|uniref:Glyoxalase n=2 Tax=Pseudoalteromonas TaxID=53246 RepID=A0A0N1EG32_9GAMM|nr:MULTISPECIES: glyoxalase [Pseudoalteromonas]KPH60775.1 glyoxalase [Pseudoalteromonas porphyrae]KPH93567.1 glyoxalase [Pseudoalteromonas porphyrae]NMR24836.1 VOC family protein [Pseudoalteromonas sp. NEC-BIFX-2020_015]NNG43434.1 VOC family protein [Pseudoalteromonas sp. NEC-BIFX-2020_002]
MQSLASIFEIPATDLDRAVKFYSNIFTLTIETMDIPGMKMGLFPYKDQSTVGIIIQGEGYLPSTAGLTLYLNAGEDLQVVLSKVEVYGGKVLVSKTSHADESGFFALFIDTEGNRLGLHSPN